MTNTISSFGNYPKVQTAHKQYDHFRVVFLGSPPGCGKSTLLKEYAALDNRAVGAMPPGRAAWTLQRISEFPAPTVSYFDEVDFEELDKALKEHCPKFKHIHRSLVVALKGPLPEELTKCPN